MNWFLRKYIERRVHRYTMKQVEHYCSDCGQKGLVVRRMSILNVAFWFLLGIGVFLYSWSKIGFGIATIFFGMVVWFGATYINMRLVKPQCHHCLSPNIRIPLDEEELQRLESQLHQQQA